MYRILLILYIIYGEGCQLQVDKTLITLSPNFPLIKDYHKLLLPPLQWIRKEDYG